VRRAVEQQELARLPGFLQRRVHALRLPPRDELVRGAVDQEHRRRRPRRVREGRGESRRLGVRCSLAHQGVDHVGAAPADVVRTVVRDHAPHRFGHLAERTGQIRREVRHVVREMGEHGQVRTGGHAEEREALRIDAQLARVRAHPAQAVAHVVEGRRKAAGRGEAVRDRDRRDAFPGEVERVAGRLARVAAHPAAAVHEDHRRGRARRPHRPVVVEAQRDPTGLRVHHVGAELVDVRAQGNAGNLAREGHERMA
jgi:hypothetical protein